MLTLEQGPHAAEVVESRRKQPVLLVSPVVVALGVIPLVSEGSVTPLRALTALVLIGTGILCVRLGWPRAIRRPLPNVGRPVELMLTSSEEEDAYQAQLVGDDGRRELVLARDEPAGILADALRLALFLQVPLTPAWGLTAAELRVFDATERAGSAAGRVSGMHRPLLEQRVGMLASFWASLFVVGGSAVMALSPDRPPAAPAALSLVLPALTALVPLAVGVWLVGLKEELVIDAARVERQRSWFGHPLGGRGVDRVRVLGSFPVSAGAGGPFHVLVATERGPLAVVTDSQAGASFLLHPAKSDKAPGRAAE